MGMSVLFARCAGLDVHKLTVVACLMLTSATGTLTKEVRTFATTTAGLLALADWLESHEVTHDRPIPARRSWHYSTPTSPRLAKRLPQSATRRS